MELKVNGKKHQIEANENDLLLYVLRNDLNCKGVRFGCGAGHCGACTVWMDGRPVQTCDMPIWGVGDKEISTIEELEKDSIGAVVIEEFHSMQAAQCGYCINGILMSVTSMLKRTLKPTAEELDEVLHRHLCRCGAHPRIFRAISAAAERLGGGTPA